MEFIFNFLAFFLALIVIFYLLLCIIPVQMAAKRGRNIIIWFVLAIFTSPFLAILMIACIGETDEKRKERIIQEEEWRNMYCRKSNQDKYENSNRVESRHECKTEQREYKEQQMPSKTNVPSSENKRMTINDLYRK